MNKDENLSLKLFIVLFISVAAFTCSLNALSNSGTMSTRLHTKHYDVMFPEVIAPQVGTVLYVESIDSSDNVLYLGWKPVTANYSNIPNIPAANSRMKSFPVIPGRNVIKGWEVDRGCITLTETKDDSLDRLTGYWEITLSGVKTIKSYKVVAVGDANNGNLWGATFGADLTVRTASGDYSFITHVQEQLPSGNVSSIIEQTVDYKLEDTEVYIMGIWGSMRPGSSLKICNIEIEE